MPSFLSLSLHVETKTQSLVVGIGCLLSSPCHTAWERLVLRSAPRPVSRPVLLACLIRPCGPHRLIGSPLARIAWLPAPFDKRDGAEQSAGGGRCLVMRLTAGIGWRAAAACLPRMAMGGGRSSTADGCGRRALAWLLACLGSMDGAARSFLDRSSFPSSSHPIDEAPAPFIISSSHRRGGTFFSFSPDPLPPALLGLLAWGCSPVSGRGMRGLRHGLRRRVCGLFACVLVSRAALSLPLVRSLHMPYVARAARSFLGRRWAFYGLF